MNSTKAFAVVFLLALFGIAPAIRAQPSDHSPSCRDHLASLVTSVHSKPGLNRAKSDPEVLAALADAIETITKLCDLVAQHEDSAGVSVGEPDTVRQLKLPIVEGAMPETRK